MKRIFLADMDGTLIDSLDLIVEAFGTALGGGRSRDEVLKLFGPPEGTVLGREVGPDRAPRALAEFYRIYEEGLHRLHPYPGVERLLDRLERDGWRLGLVTGKDSRTTMATLRHFGWERRFAAVVHGDDVLRPKPDPEPVRLALQRLEAYPREAVFLGDSGADVRAGRAAGVLTLGALWGFHFGSALLRSEPDRICREAGEVVEFLLEG